MYTNMFTKPLTRAPWYMLIKSLFLAIGWSYLHDLSHRFLKDWNYYKVKLQDKSALFSTDNSQTSRLSIFYRISNHKNFIPKYIDKAHKLHEHWGGYWEKKRQWTILEEQFPVPRNTVVGKIKW